MASISRLCSNCKIHTLNDDNCSQCGKLLNFEMIRALEEVKKKESISSKPPDELDILFKSFKHSRFIVVRLFYQIAYSIWFVLGAIVSFFLFLIAMGPG